MPTPGIYYGTVEQAFSGMWTDKDGAEVPFLDLNFKVNHRQEGEGWVQCDEKGKTRMFFGGKNDDLMMKVLAQLGFNGDFVSPSFSEPNCMLKCYHQNGYPRWQVQLPDARENSDTKIEATAAARLSQRFKAFNGGGQPAAPTAPVAPAAAPASATAPPAPTVPTTQEQLGVAPPAAPVNNGAVPLPGQGDEEIPF